VGEDESVLIFGSFEVPDCFEVIEVHATIGIYLVIVIQGIAIGVFEEWEASDLIGEGY
jgi:hypothetical protein